MRHCVALAFAVLILGAGSGFAEESIWLQAQTYGMLPLDPEEAAAKGWTVNGLWTGYGMSEAVRGTTHLVSGQGEYPAQWSYATTKDYIDACHEVDVLVPGTIFGIGEHVLLRKRFPQIEQSACRLADGSTAYYEAGSRLFMCSNNSVYDDVMIELGNEAIDAGADLIVFDEIQGNELSLYWPNSTGYCERCLAAYREHLSSKYTTDELKEKFGIEELDTLDFVKRLGPQGGKKWDDTDTLFKELWNMQKRRSFERGKKIADGLRAHMKEVGRKIPICANTTEMGLEESAGIRLSGVQWGQVVDFAAYERLSTHLLPRGKWVASERLADASFRLPSAVEIRYAPLSKIQQEYLAGKSNRSVYFYGLLAEAYANGVAFVNYHQEKGLPKAAGLWADVFKAQRFILDHRDLFKPKAETGANVAILYIENEGMRYRTGSYIGMAQVLAESSIPFDVIIDGGDGFVPVTLTADKLEPYQLVIVPQALQLAPEQKAAVDSYVSGGGTVLTADPKEFGVEPDDDVVSRGKGKFVVLFRADRREGPEGKRPQWDAAAAYFHEYYDDLRVAIAGIVNKHSDTVLELDGADRTVCAYPRVYPEEKRVVIHMVNSDYDPEHNRMRAKTGLTLRVRRPEWYKEIRDVVVYSPDFSNTDSRRLAAREKDKFIEVTLPKLDVYAVVVL